MTATTGKSRRLKGHNFEREMAKKLSSDTGKEFTRGLGQTRAGATEDPDVYLKDDRRWHFECKRQTRCNIKGALRQAKEDIAKSNESRIPVVITKDDRDDILVTMRYEEWVLLFADHLAKGAEDLGEKDEVVSE